MNGTTGATPSREKGDDSRGTPQPTPTGREERVIITYEPSNPNSKEKIRVDKLNFWVSKGDCEQVRWVAENSNGSIPPPRFTIDFNGKNGSPFNYTQFSDQVPFSGLVRREVLADLGKNYEYTIRIGEDSRDPGGGVRP